MCEDKFEQMEYKKVIFGLTGIGDSAQGAVKLTGQKT